MAVSGLSAASSAPDGGACISCCDRGGLADSVGRIRLWEIQQFAWNGLPLLADAGSRGVRSSGEKVAQSPHGAAFEAGMGRLESGARAIVRGRARTRSERVCEQRTDGELDLRPGVVVALPDADLIEQT